MQMSMLDNIIEIQVCEKIGVSDLFGKVLAFYNNRFGILNENLVKSIHAYADPYKIYTDFRSFPRGPTNENQLSLFSKPLIS